MYGNEEEVGRAVRESGLRREDVFITTKLPPDRVGRERETLEASLEALGVDHVDLWLIHWPPSSPADSIPVWRELLAARDEGLARAVGVSNYSTGRDRRADPGDRGEPGGQPDPVEPVAVRPAAARRAPGPGRGAGGVQPVQDQRPRRPGADPDRRRARRLPGPGGAALAHRPRDRGDPEVGDPGADHAPTSTSSTSRSPPRRCATSTRSARSDSAVSFSRERR